MYNLNFEPNNNYDAVIDTANSFILSDLALDGTKNAIDSMNGVVSGARSTIASARILLASFKIGA